MDSEPFWPHPALVLFYLGLTLFIVQSPETALAGTWSESKLTGQHSDHCSVAHNKTVAFSWDGGSSVLLPASGQVYGVVLPHTALLVPTYFPPGLQLGVRNLVFLW